MFKAKYVVLVAVILVSAVGLVLFVIGSLRPKLAGVFIDTSPGASVWIDGKQVGRTPFRETLKPSDVVVRLIPDSFETPLAPYETKVSLVAGVETVIRYDFGDTQELSAGDIISFEKNAGKEVSLVAVSSPDSAQLTVDGLEKAFTPHKTSALTSGKHELKFSLAGYLDRTVEVKTHEGYKLTAVVKLAKIPESGEPESVSTTSAQAATVPNLEQVEILSTPTGFLRVRSEASTLADEVGQVGPGESYPLISVDEKTGWYQIDLGNSKKGWISNQYARKVSGGKTVNTPTPGLKVSTFPTQSPTPTLTPSQ